MNLPPDRIKARKKFAKKMIREYEQEIARLQALIRTCKLIGGLKEG